MVMEPPRVPDWHRDDASPDPDRETVQRWLDAYVAAWQSWDESAIADLWSEDAIWYRPFGIRARGRDAITSEWFAEQHLFQDHPYEGRYEPIAVDGGRVVAHGRTTFYDPDSGEPVTEYDNVWLLRFDGDGRCSEFHEWYARRE